MRARRPSLHVTLDANRPLPWRRSDGRRDAEFFAGRMTFEEYCRLEGASDTEKTLRFLLGVSSSMLQRRYLVVPSRVNLKALWPVDTDGL